MITAPPGVRVLVWSAPVDFRSGMDRLAALVGLGQFPRRKAVLPV